MDSFTGPEPRARVAGELCVESLAGPAALAALEPEWWALWRADPRASAFQSPAWLLPWGPSFGHEPLAFAVRAAGALVALVACFRLPVADGGEALLLLGSGNTDLLDGVFAPGWAQPACAALAPVLARLRGVERVELQCLRADSPLRALPPLAGWSASERDEHVRLVRDLSRPLRPERARRVRYYERRLAALGRVELERADERSLERLLAELAAVHAARWRLRGEPGVLADPCVRAFLARAAPRLLRAGLLRLLALRVGGRPAALLLGLLARGSFGVHLTAFEPELARANPGEVLLARALEAARGEGAVELDFLRGDEPYKRAWDVTARPLLQRVLRPPP